MDVLYPQDGSLSNENEVEHLSHQDKCASFYMFTMQSLDSATSDYVYAGLSKSAGNAALNLSRAALWIAQWTDSDVGSLSQSLREAAEASSDRARKAADARHNKPGGSRQKQDAIRAAWATGKYTSRDICAEQECAALMMSFSTARKALRNTINPS
ncbi:MAG: hypothetical protein Q8O29_04545 [Polaromonas sp.]|uniref:hypothetical protein n=1 Tax=Polaromonas sp. TaxID=1869339 RepID=UPI0027327A14|nr:hypothetical protein [Polaromonas sp.]MDP2817539.1 hypothetical protein [Polaromonas sp.]